ncbi:MAG: chemotaxis protein CheX [Bdellovibrio sp.]
MKTSVMNVDDKTLLKILNDAVRETFQNFLGCNPEIIQTVRDRNDHVKENNRSISGTVAFLQQDFEGTLTIGFSRESAIKLFKSFYQAELNSVEDARITEGIAELANVIHGLVKERLNIQGYNFQMCLPVVVIGKNHAVFAHRDCPGVSLIFQTEFGNFSVEVISSRKAVLQAA